MFVMHQQCLEASGLTAVRAAQSVGIGWDSAVSPSLASVLRLVASISLIQSATAPVFPQELPLEAITCPGKQLWWRGPTAQEGEAPPWWACRAAQRPTTAHRPKLTSACSRCLVRPLPPWHPVHHLCCGCDQHFRFSVTTWTFRGCQLPDVNTRSSRDPSVSACRRISPHAACTQSHPQRRGLWYLSPCQSRRQPQSKSAAPRCRAQ